MRPPLFGIGMQGKNPVVTAKKLTNVYCEFRQSGEKSQVVAFGSPGLLLFGAPSIFPTRGKPLLFDSNDLLYLVQGSTFWQVNNAGVAVARGTLGTATGFVSMAHNGFAICIVDGTNIYFYNPTTLTFSTSVSAGQPTSPQTVVFLDGRFFVNKGQTGQFNFDILYNPGPNWGGGALDFAVAESNPDNLIAVTADHGQLILLGSKTTEFWNKNDSVTNPYLRIDGTSIEWGLAAKASVVKFDNSIAFLAKNIMGQVTVVRLNGYQPQRIANSDLETIINQYAVVEDATSFSYLLNGHPMLQMNFPSAGYSWLFDGSTGIWSSMKSFNINRHFGEFAADYLKKTIVTDYTNGNLYQLRPDVYTDNGAMIEREIIGEHWDSPDLVRETIHLIRMDMETGVGLVSGQGSDPQMMLAVSKDRGRTWSSERWRPFGKIGQYRTTVEWWRWGMSRNWTFRWRETDPVAICILGVVVNPQD